MKQFFIIISLFFTVTLIVGPALSADLSSNIMKRVNWANQYLDEAEGQISSGRAEFAGKNIKGAREEYGNISKYYGGSYDSAHPTLTTLQERIKTVADNVKNAMAAPRVSAPTQAIKPQSSTISKTAPAGAAKSGKKSTAAPAVTDLSSNIMKRVNGANQYLDEAESQISSGRAEFAGKNIKGAREEYGNIAKYYSGSYDSAHPTLTTLQVRIQTVAEKVKNTMAAAVLARDAKIARDNKLAAETAAKADKAEEKLMDVVTIIHQNTERLEQAHENAKWKVRGIESAISDGNGDKLLAEMEKARGSVERVNALLPAARQAVTDFRKQYPDRKALQKFETVHNKHKFQAVDKIERFPKFWLDMEVGRTVTVALDSAESNIKAYGSDHLAKLEGKVEAQKEYGANTSQEFVVIFSSILLETIDVLLPELPEADKALLPEFVTARKQALDRAAPLRADIVKVEVAVRKVLKDVVDSKHRKLAAARFPKSTYHGGKWDDAEKVIRIAFKASIHDKELLKIDIYRPWEVREEAKWRNDHWEINTYRYIGANCLAKLSSGKHRVYRMTFRNTKLADGSWSALELWGVGHSYEILQENIDK